MFRCVSSIAWVFLTLLICWFAQDIGKIIPLASSAVLHFQFTIPGELLLFNSYFRFEPCICIKFSVLMKCNSLGLCLLQALRLEDVKFSKKRIRILATCGVFYVVFGLVLSTMLLVQYLMDDTSVDGKKRSL